MAGRESERLLSVLEAAAIMQVSRMSVYRMIERGVLPRVLVGGSARVPEAAIDDHLRQTWGMPTASATTRSPEPARRSPRRG